MSTNKTPYSLMHLWEPQDTFVRQEFNENFTIVDTELKDLATSIAAMNAALTQVLSMTTGTYSGSGTRDKDSQTISLGRKPRMVFIWNIERANAMQVYAPKHAMLTPGVTLIGGEILDNGFRVSYTTDGNNSPYYPALNQSGTNYSYAAFF